MQNLSKPFAVIVLNWNGLDLLKEFVPQWLAYAHSDLSDLIIVDNGSTDSSVAYLQENYPEIQLLTFEENLGYAEGYNRAVAQLDYKYLVLLNSDATPKSKTWLDQAYFLFENNEKLGAIQPKIKSYQSPQSFEYAGAGGGKIDLLGYPFCFGRVFSKISEDKGQYDQVEELKWASGASLMIRRDVYLSVGGLDARFFAHQEEIDICMRLLSRSWQILLAPESEVFHVGGGSLDMNSPRKLYLNYRNNLLMLYKNLDLWHLVAVLYVRLFLDFFILLAFLILGNFKKAKAVFQAYYDFIKAYPSFRSDRLYNQKVKTIASSLSLFDPTFILVEYLKFERN